jgi:ketosteroid isomerase-like protein
MSKYVLSQTHHLCHTNITRLHFSCHRHSNCVLPKSHAYISLVTDSDCVLQTSYGYICLVKDTSIVSYRHHTPTYVLSQTHQLCLTDIIRLHMSCHINTICVLQTLHAYICLVTETAIVSYRHHMSTYVSFQTHQSCVKEITRLHTSCDRHINCVLQTLHAYLCLFTDTSIVSYKHYIPTYVLSQTLQLCLTDITRLHISCHRYINCVWQTLHAYICLLKDTSFVPYRHHMPTYVLSQTHQLFITDITRLHMSCQRHINCVLQTSHVYICLVTDTSIVSYRHYTPTSVLS